MPMLKRKGGGGLNNTTIKKTTFVGNTESIVVVGKNFTTAVGERGGLIVQHELHSAVNLSQNSLTKMMQLIK